MTWAAPPPAPWHTLPPGAALEALGSATRGLSDPEARDRLAQAGPNVLPGAPTRSLLGILRSQLANVMTALLVTAAIIAGVVGEPADVVTIAVILVLNTVLGFVQEYRAERAVERLRSMAAPQARVRRDGAEGAVPVAELVPGDVVLLEAGTIVPADLRLVEAPLLRVDESALTGESEAVLKSVDALHDLELPLADRRDMAYRGTIVTYGRGAGLVTATGAATEIGRIATLLAEE
ncbi:MAG TPA: HAD-IC family P-type ATPase, partial [Gemmatimonadales bacterium]|nr:HAD-IC family P-type ATPase [Gemmatimonadales bacterium]